MDLEKSKQSEIDELKTLNAYLEYEKMELQSELEKFNAKTCVSGVMDATDYKSEYMKLREQFDNAIKTIKYISSLL